MAFIELKVPSQAQVYSGIRYAGVAAGSVGTALTFFGVIPADQAHALVESFQKVTTDIQQLIGDSAAFLYLAIPIVTILLAKLGWNSARPQSQIASAQAMEKVQVITTDPNIAQTVPGVKLVSTLNEIPKP